MSFYFEVNKISDVYNRRYVKVQDLLASVGGLIKMLFTIASLMVYISNNKMLIELGNVSFKQHNSYSIECLNLSKPMTNELKDITDKKDPIQLNDSNLKIHQNNFINEKKEMPENLNMTLYDYLKSVFNCKSKYTKKNYEKIQNLIRKQLEISSIVLSTLMTHKLSQILFREEYEKAELVPKIDSEFKITDDKECENLLKKLSDKILLHE